MDLIAYVVVLTVAFIVIMRVIIAYMQYVTHRAVTDHFQAAEAISEGRVPEQWVAQINRRSGQGKNNQIKLVIDKADRLYRFFEQSPFVESEMVREQLLQQIQQVSATWKVMTWEELKTEHDAIEEASG